MEYCWPNRGSGCGWSLGTPEWQSSEFEEGFATFLGDRAIYYQQNPQPYTCYASATYCGATYNVEASTLSLGRTCATNEGRWPISLDRYLRDVYDTVQDPPQTFCNGDICITDQDVVSIAHYQFFDVFHAYTAGMCGNHLLNGPWCWDWTGLDADVDYPDERSGEDFTYFTLQHLGVQTVDAYNMNCAP